MTFEIVYVNMTSFKFAVKKTIEYLIFQLLSMHTQGEGSLFFMQRIWGRSLFFVQELGGGSLFFVDQDFEKHQPSPPVNSVQALRPI